MNASVNAGADPKQEVCSAREPHLEVLERSESPGEE